MRRIAKDLLALADPNLSQEPDLKVNKGTLEAEITALQNVDALPAGTDKFRYEDLVPQFARQ